MESTTTRPASFQLPKPLGQLLSRLPAYPGSLLLVAAINHLLGYRLPADVLGHLRHKTLRIDVRDAGIGFDFTCTGTRFVACPRRGPADLAVSASAQDFFRMARRQEDPDTLFFNRRLSMEGDTELGLLVKNALDALELPVLHLGRFAKGPK
jgi:predicted lipid carrier protein YhbT